MKRFKNRAIKEALAYVAEGGQALHGTEAIPAGGKRVLWFHLFDNDLDRLIATVKRLGVRRAMIERMNQRGQHIDLCGAPLKKAFAECKEGMISSTQ